MAKKYKHLSMHERDQIAVWRGQGLSLREIARRLQRSPGTLSRELKRNGAPIYTACYLAHRAQARAGDRWRIRHRKRRLKSERLRRYVRCKLEDGWSPELIAGRLAHLARRERVSHEAIYQWLYAEARELVATLAHAHRKRLPRGHSRKHRKPHIPQRVSIQERPATVAARRQAGHWEVDTAVSRHGPAALAVMAERKTLFTKLRRLRRKTARQLRVAITRRMAHHPRRLRRSFTYDNGSENVEHLEVNRVLGSKSYFCEPFHSWEKGTVENTIGLVRRHFPKGTDFTRVPDREIKRVERWLNHRPRKRLGFMTPAEAFCRECCT